MPAFPEEPLLAPEPRPVLHVPDPVPRDLGNVQEGRGLHLDRGGG
jgi:hypothetical protein